MSHTFSCTYYDVLYMLYKIMTFEKRLKKSLDAIQNKYVIKCSVMKLHLLWKKNKYAQ